MYQCDAHLHDLLRWTNYMIRINMHVFVSFEKIDNYRVKSPHL